MGWLFFRPQSRCTFKGEEKAVKSRKVRLTKHKKDKTTGKEGRGGGKRVWEKKKKNAFEVENKVRKRKERREGERIQNFGKKKAQKQSG